MADVFVLKLRIKLSCSMNIFIINFQTPLYNMILILILDVTTHMILIFVTGVFVNFYLKLTLTKLKVLMGSMGKFLRIVPLVWLIQYHSSSKHHITQDVFRESGRWPMLCRFSKRGTRTMSKITDPYH